MARRPRGKLSEHHVGIAYQLDIHLNAAELLDILTKIVPSGRVEFADFLASQI